MAARRKEKLHQTSFRPKDRKAAERERERMNHFIENRALDNSLFGYFQWEEGWRGCLRQFVLTVIQTLFGIVN